MRLDAQQGSVALEMAAERLWRDILNALPERFRRRFSSAHWRTVAPAAPLVTAAEPSAQPIAVVLPADAVLFRRIELPLISRWNLPGLMRFEATRHIPLPPSEARVDYRIVARDAAAGRMLVELAITRTETVLHAEAQARAAGAAPEAVLLDSQDGPWLSRRLLAKPWRQVWLTRRHLRLLIRAALPTFLLVGLALAAQGWAARFAQSRADAVSAARLQAAGIGPLRQELAQLNAQIAELAAARARPSAAAIADEVAKRLPDDAWAQELDIEPQTVRVIGTARDATSLIRLFSASPLFSDVQFEAPLTPAPTGGGDQFDLVMTIN